MDKTVFDRDQREIVLAVIRRIKKDFDPVYGMPELDYANHLLKNLNNNPKTECKANDTPLSIEYQFSADKLKELSEQQSRQEMEKYVVMHDCNILHPIEQIPPDNNYHEILNDLYTEWHTEFCATFTSIVEKMKTSLDEDDRYLYAFFNILEPKTYTDIVINEIKNLLQKHGSYQLRMGYCHYDLGDKIQLHIDQEIRKLNGVLNKNREIYDEYCKKIYFNDENSRQKWQRLEHYHKHHGASLDKQYINKTTKEKTKIGRILFQIATKTMKIDENRIKGIKEKSKKKAILGVSKSKKDNENYITINNVLVM